LRDAAHALLRQWNAYRESDLSQMNAHDLLVRYELWNALDAALWEKPPATNQEAGAALPIVERLRDGDDLHSRIEAADTIERLMDALRKALGMVIDATQGTYDERKFHQLRALLAKLEAGDS
jgi:hypothetical protein